MLFQGIQPNSRLDSIESAVQRVHAGLDSIATAEEQRSLAELRLSDQDYEWLLDWAAALDTSTIRTCFRWGRLQNSSIPLTTASALGALVLLLAAERGRREATENLIWPIVLKSGFRDDVREQLFGRSYPVAELQYALEYAAKGLRLRHVFDEVGVQRWYDTIYLQFGFTVRGMRNRLPEWLAGHGRPQAVSRLLEGPLFSHTFSRLWNTMLGYRRSQISESRLRDELRDNPWILPDWGDDIVRLSVEKLQLGTAESISRLVTTTDDTFVLNQPRFSWNPPSPPSINLSPNPLHGLELRHPHYDLWLFGRRAGRMIRRQEDDYRWIIEPAMRDPSDPQSFYIPLDRPELAAELFSPENQSFANWVWPLWDASEDVAIITLTGRCTAVDPIETPLDPSRKYALIARSDMRIDPLPPLSHRLPDSGWTVYMLDAGWNRNITASLDEAPCWWPLIQDFPRGDQTLEGLRCVPHGAGRRVRLGAEIRFAFHHAPDVHIRKARIAGTTIPCFRRNSTQTLTDVVSLRENAPHNPVHITVILEHAGSLRSVRLPVEMDLVGLVGSDGEGWRVYTESTALRADRATRQVFKCWAPSDDFKQWSICEGTRQIASPSAYPRPLAGLQGLGGPLTLRSWGDGHSAPILLARSCIRHGVIRRVTTDRDGQVQITMESSRSPEDRDSLCCWQHSGQVHLERFISMSNTEGNPIWKTSLQPVLTRWRAMAILSNGQCHGAIWKPDWHQVIPSREQADTRITAGILRGLRLPILAPEAVDDVRRFAEAYGPDVLRAWLLDSRLLQPDIGMPPINEGWLATVRTIFRNWQPTATEAALTINMVHSLDGDQKRLACCLDALRQLNAVSPILMGRIARAGRNYIRSSAALYPFLLLSVGLANLYEDCWDATSKARVHRVVAQRYNELIRESKIALRLSDTDLGELLIESRKLALGIARDSVVHDHIDMACQHSVFRQLSALDILERIEEER